MGDEQQAGTPADQSAPSESAAEWYQATEISADPNIGIECIRGSGAADDNSDAVYLTGDSR